MQPVRILEFRSLGESLAEVERLLEGHTTAGRWSLGQILDHLATALRLTMLGPTGPAAEPRSDVLRRLFFRRGRFPEGIEAPTPLLIPAPDVDVDTAAGRLREAIAGWDSADGPFPPHPRLGVMSREEWDRFQCMHCAHHLGFAVPVIFDGGVTSPGSNAGRPGAAP